MDIKNVQRISLFHKYVKKAIECDFEDIKFENGKSIVISVLDETDTAYIYTKGSEGDVTLALCQLFDRVSKLGDSVLFCESFAEMLSCENAENLYNSIKNRADFDCFHEEIPEDDEDGSDKIKTISDEDLEKIHNGDFSPFKNNQNGNYC